MFHKVLIASLLLVTSATAHDAPLGWRYGVECCSTIDCWQEKDGAIKETKASSGSLDYVVSLDGPPLSSWRSHEELGP